MNKNQCNKRDIQMEDSWKELLWDEFQKPYMCELKRFLQLELSQGKTIYPQAQDIFQAFNQTPFDKVKVVIIGQDPYHGPDQAHGMCFSVRPGIRPPPSLRNIYKELESDIAAKTPSHGYLINWARQGVLMLNAVLTVEKTKAGSHHGKGWERFTDRVIDILNEEKNNLVFLLWGSPAQKKASQVNHKKHLILKAPHPSPLSAHRGFLGCRHFSKVNNYLQQHHLTPIDWQLPLQVNL
ncbi:MAG: uracil-DNA glycosylase [Bacteriovoracia bacterium]